MDKPWYPATFGRRFAAIFIDSLIFFGISLVAGILQAFNMPIPEWIIILLYPTYAVLFIWLAGATPGKMAMGLRVVTQDDKKLNFFQALFRETLAKWISMIPFYLGFLWVIWDKKKEAWHDKMAKTKVVTHIPNNGKENSLVFVILGLALILPILGILATVILIAINPAGNMVKAQDVKRQADERQIQSALQLYYLDNNAYPTTLNQLVPSYLPRVPTDPISSREYRYTLDTKTNSYQFCVTFGSETQKKETCVTPKQ